MNAILDPAILPAQQAQPGALAIQGLSKAYSIDGRSLPVLENIDLAVRLGLGYPLGPLEWGDRMGAGRVLRILERLHALSGDPRYRPSPWLRRRAQLGLSLRQPDSPLAS